MPSQYLKLKRELRQEANVIDPEWLCFCFDNAVLWFGGWIESKLYERDPMTHELIHELEDLLVDEDTHTSPISDVERIKFALVRAGIPLRST